MATPANVKIGVCNVSYNGTDLGYTSGGVSISYSADTNEVEVDQEAYPIKEIITKQNFEVTVPMAEYNLEIFKELLPGTTLTTGDDTTSTDTLVLSGEVTSLSSTIDTPLVITPADGGPEETITIANATITPSLEFSFEKDNARVYEITFKASAPNSEDADWVKFGTGAAPA